MPFEGPERRHGRPQENQKENLRGEAVVGKGPDGFKRPKRTSTIHYTRQAETLLNRSAGLSEGIES